MPNVLFTNRYQGTPLDVIRQEMPDGFALRLLSDADRDTLIDEIATVEYMVVGGRLPIDSEVIESARRVKMIQRTGVGTDGIDLPYLKRKGIPFYLNPGINAASVAEHTIMLILCVLRRLPVADAGVRAGRWLKHELGLTCGDLRGKTVGMIGAGYIGREVARRLHAFDVEVIYFKRSRMSESEEADLYVKYCHLDELLRRADIVSLHCALTSETKGLIDAHAFVTMKEDAIIVNTARGGLIDQQAMIEALRNGGIRGAGLDVFADEPPPSDSPLLQLDNVVLTPHMGGLTLETFRGMMRQAWFNIRAFHEGRLSEIEDKRLI